MKDYLTIGKLTELFRVIKDLVGQSSFSMEEFLKDVTFDRGDADPQVLRELTPEEADLFYMDYAVFRALRQKEQDFERAGVGRFEMGGGIFYKIMEGLCGFGGKSLVLMALREFAGDKRLEGKNRTVRVELIEDALCYTAVSVSPEEIAKLMAQDVKLVVVVGGSPSTNDKSSIDENFNLEAWNPDGKNFQ